LAEAAQAVFVDGLKCSLQPARACLDARTLGAHLPLRSAGEQIRLSIQMDWAVARELLQRFGGGLAPEDAVLLTEVVTECANLLAGRLAGLVSDEFDPMDMGTPCAGVLPLVDPQAVVQRYACSCGDFLIRLEEVV
jgi:hypothetical protein